MGVLKIHFQDGFTGDEVILSLDGTEIYHKQSVKTHPLVGLAGTFAFESTGWPGHPESLCPHQARLGDDQPRRQEPALPWPVDPRWETRAPLLRDRVQLRLKIRARADRRSTPFGRSEASGRAWPTRRQHATAAGAEELARFATDFSGDSYVIR